ncbi:unnamed protein product [Alopecurus aequalis]
MKAAGRRRREDRLSNLSDAMLERILSFLPTKEAARAAALSSRWRDTFVGVDAVSLEAPESPIPDYEDDGCGSPCCTFGVPEDPHPTPPFTTTVTAALLARHSAPAPAPPLRSLRVVMNHYRREDVSTVDNWVSYALKNAARAPAGLELDLRLRRVPICVHPYTLHVAGTRKRRRSTYAAEEEEANRRLQMSGSDEDSKPDSDEDSDQERRRSMSHSRVYTVPGRLFSCAALRSLSIGPCRLSPPAAVSLPSLERLLLARVSDQERSVQKLLEACPRLADLTLEACGTVTALYLAGNQRLRRLALRCCHRLEYVVVDDRLHSLEYRGAVPDTSLLAFRRGRGPKFRSCKIHICGEEVSSAKELAKLGKFLQLVASTKHLHLHSARLGFGVEHDALATSLPEFTRLTNLELTGRLPHGDGDAAVAAVSRILRQAPSLEVITLVFHTGPKDDESRERCSSEEWKEGELIKANHLRYTEHEVLPSVPAVSIPACLKKRVREINLVHYHGGRAQRTLAKFLLCNAQLLDRLYCGFAPGSLSIQKKLRDEIQGWAVNKPENSIFE